MRELWNHQAEALQALRQSVRQGVRRIVLQSPTGSGKTALAAAVVESALNKGYRVAFIVPRLDLIDQTLQHFAEEGIRDVGVVQGNHFLTDWAQPVQICSVQTINRRDRYPEAQVVIIDECHELHKGHVEWLHDPEWRHVPFIGLSATPWRKGLGKHFESLLIAATTRDLIDKGFLSKFRVFATGHPDLRGVKIVAGDYHEGQLSQAMQQGGLSADIVDTWRKRWGKDKTLCFAVDCAHAKALYERFVDAGIGCAYQDASTSLSGRAEIRRGFHSGIFRVVVNVGTLTTGVDWDVRCLILARPTRSEMLYTQIVGRALRVAEGKDEAVILDHSDSTMRLGFVTDIGYDALHNGNGPLISKHIPPKPKPCPQCAALRPRGKLQCENCGFVVQPPVSRIAEDDGVDLVELDPFDISIGARRLAGKRKWSTEEKRAFYAMLMGYALERGYADGWISHQYREKFGCWPNGMRDVPAAIPSMQMRAWIRSRQIRYAMSKKRASGLPSTPSSSSSSSPTPSPLPSPPSPSTSTTAPPWD